jgi:hypothetical protein
MTRHDLELVLWALLVGALLSFLLLCWWVPTP